MVGDPLQPFSYSGGPSTARIAIVGEAWGEKEDLTGMPFVGASGQELTRLLAEAGILRQDCFLTNAFAMRPPQNKIDALCGPKAAVGKDYPLAPLAQGKYILREYLPHVARLQQELTTVRPNLVLCLGNTACWAVLGSARIGSIRGTVAESHLVDGLKVLPTYHPSAVLRNWALRPIVVADLMKASREALFPDIVRPRREILIDPTIWDLLRWVERPMQILACDIETKRKQITAISFARTPADGIVIPFWDQRKPSGSYWDSPVAEALAWGIVRYLLEMPVVKLFQNGLYDLLYLLRMGFRPQMCWEDTMLRHHAMYPELQKGLGFLGSIYSSESSWKLLNRPAAGKDAKAND